MPPVQRDLRQELFVARKPYIKPAVIQELTLETRAGSLLEIPEIADLFTNA